METIISTISWLLKKVADTAVGAIVGKATQSALSKAGIFEAKCERCNTVQPAVVIPENKPFTLECSKCGNTERIFIESVDKLIVRSIRQANIAIDSANVLINQANFPQQPYSNFPSLPNSEKQLQEQTQTSTLPANEFQSAYGIIERKVIERAIQEAIYAVKNNADDYNLSMFAIKEYRVFEIGILTSPIGTTDVICPEIWIVPDSRKSIAKINAAIQKTIDESLNEIGLSLGKIITRIYDEKLPKK